MIDRVIHRNSVKGEGIMLRMCVFIVLLLPIWALASDRLFWECKAYSETWDRILLRLVASPDNGIGAVYAAGSEQIARYGTEGLDRRWDFGINSDGNGYDFAILMRPTGETLYYNFTIKSEASPSQRYWCRPKD